MQHRPKAPAASRRVPPIREVLRGGCRLKQRRSYRPAERESENRGSQSHLERVCTSRRGAVRTVGSVKTVAPPLGPRSRVDERRRPLRRPSHTGKMSAKVSAKRPRAMNQAPTTMSTYPPQCLTAGAPLCSRLTSCCCAMATPNAAANSSRIRTTAVTANATTAAAEPPVVSACPARPARMGPVHPKPAAR